MAHEMSKLGAKAMGKAKAVGKMLKGETGILSHLAAEHGEVAGLLQRIASSIDDTDTKRELFPEVRVHLLAHAQAEEEAFYPVLRGQASLAALVDRSLEEHREIERLVQQLSTTHVDTPAWKTSFDHLHRAVQQHVELEEDEIFERTKDLFDSEQRSRMYEEYEKAEQAAKASQKRVEQLDDEITKMLAEYRQMTAEAASL